MNVNANISLFRSYRDTKTAVQITIEDFCANIVSGDYKNEVLAIRDLESKADRDKIKSKLPAATISGTFSKRCNIGLMQHSGFICMDFDTKSNPEVKDWPATRNHIGAIGEVLFCALSVSGRGCFAIIPIRYPEKHRAQFDALKRDFIKHINLIPDVTPDVARLRGISYDPDATWQPNAEEYKRIYTTPVKNSATPAHGSTFDKIKAWVDSRQSFAPGNRNIYIMCFAGACHRLGFAQVDCENELIRYSTQDFTEKEILRTIKSIYKNQNWVK